MITIPQILAHWQPTRGWQVIETEPPTIVALDGGSVPTLEDVELHRGEVEALLATRPVLPGPAKTWATVADFNAEFTVEEKVGIITSSDISVRLLDRELLAWRGEVYSEDERVLAGLEALVASGILTTGRRAHILSTTP